MKKGLVFLLCGFFGVASLSSCEECTKCEISYTKTNGERKVRTSPQKCGYPWELDDKENEIEDAYAQYDSVDVDCTRSQ
jgi:hypothetical protein